MDICKISIEDCKLPMENYNNIDNNNEGNWSKKKYCYFIFILILSTLIACKLLYYLLFDVLL